MTIIRILIPRFLKADVVGGVRPRYDNGLHCHAEFFYACMTHHRDTTMTNERFVIPKFLTAKRTRYDILKNVMPSYFLYKKRNI